MEQHSPKNKVFKIILVVDLVCVNIIAGYLLYKSLSFKFPIQANIDTGTNDSNYDEIYKYIDEKIGGLVGVTPNPTEVPEVTITVKPTAKAVAGKKVRKEEILTIPGSGSTTGNDWTNLIGTDFYFDTRDYPGLTEVYFEANMHLFNGNGTAYVRLFDVTHGIGVTGSENNTASQAEVWTKSQKVYFWAGKNLIRVQAKSLTADTTVYNQGRLRIVTEN